MTASCAMRESRAHTHRVFFRRTLVQSWCSCCCRMPTVLKWTYWGGHDGSEEAKRRGDLKQLNDVSRAKAFEKTFAEVYVPPREAKRRPDLAATRDKRKGTFTPSK